ncbi:MAG: sulfatase-like hydrolase/transferase, partial [Candidatus Latescibacterota bacterium]|nr:sulfatase-like hydrolase/transferase [Candidatus Latescibacterota bacterium]
MSHPNIVFIITDQQRADSVGAWGNDHAITPNIDRFVGQGVSFTQAFCPGATCMASRAAIFTGMYPHNTGVYSFHDWSRHRNWVHDLSEAGYWCTNVGKMHLESGGGDDDWGRFLAHHGIERPNHRNQVDPEWLQKHQGVPWHLEERFHSDVFIGNSALAWIRDYKGDKPFFLQVGFTGPHEPWDPPQYYVDMYDPGYEGDELIYPCYGFVEDIMSERESQHVKALYAG